MRWTPGNVGFLAENAGSMSAAEMAAHFGCTAHAVYDEASRLGISLRTMPPLYWCDACATWRTEVDEDGRCPVCRIREMADRRMEAYQVEYEKARQAEAADELRARRRYNVAKKRMQRLRERTGGNPRKK